MQPRATELKNRRCVAGGCTWLKTTGILERRGFHVVIVQKPFTSLADDVSATNRLWDLQDGPEKVADVIEMAAKEAGKSPSVFGRRREP